MNHTTKEALFILALVALLFHAGGAQAQKARRAGRLPVITRTRVEETYYSFGTLYVTIGGRERKIAEMVGKAWIIQGGQRVVYSGRDGAGGFENEGQSLRVYDPRTGKHRKIMSEYTEVVKVTEVTTSGHKTALLVEMEDGGVGASYLAIVDPARGEVFYRPRAKILSRHGDIIVIGHYKLDDWMELNPDSDARMKPYKTERQNLNNVLRRPIIYNKRDE